MNNPIRPPRWMDRLLEWYCRSELLEDLQGDLHEYYSRNLHKGGFKANLIYFLDVLKFFRFYTVRKPKRSKRMTFFTMFGNYFKTSVRSIARNKLFSSINVIGLAISMSVGILMITYITELLSFDMFHKKRDRIYRIHTTYKDITEDEPLELASTSVFMGKKLQQDYSGIERLVIMRRPLSLDIRHGENVLSASGLWASEDFFDIFSFELTSGNPATVFSDPNALVITESLAKKLFKDKNPIGQTVELAGQERYTFSAGMITGVVKDPPKNSHMNFEVLASMKTLEKYAEGLNEETTLINQYNSIWMNYVYLLLPENQDPTLVQSHLDNIAREEGEKFDRFAISYNLENIQDIVPGKDLSNQIGPSVEWKMIYILTALTLIVIVSACFNYTNLSIARSLRRAKEVGIRKVVGAARSQLFAQFILEAVLMAIGALILAYGLYLVIKPEFINLVFGDGSILLDFQWIHLSYFIGFAILIGLIAGVLPSFFLSGLRAQQVLKDISRVKLMGGVSLRKTLIVFQFTLSIAFIIAATISYRQYKFALNFDLGFTTDNVLNIELKGNDPELLAAAFASLPEVVSISKSAMVPSIGSVWGDEVKYKDLMDSASIHLNNVDRNYLLLHNFKFLAGSTFPFDVKKGDQPKFMVINEQLLKRFNFESPEAAIGEVLTVDNDKKLEITGVVRDFHHGKVSDDLAPFAFIQATDDIYVLNLLVRTADMIGLMGKLEAIWKKNDPVHPFQAEFYDDQIQQAYSDYSTYFKVIGFLAFLAISIATLGLLGMAVFTTETRLKEISIRKVLGATEQNLIYLLSRGFIMMLLVASAIAVPATYLLFENFLLTDFAYRISLGFIELFSGVILIFGIGFLVIGWQTSRAARTNPADMLRDE